MFTTAVEEIAKGTSIQLHDVTVKGTQSRKNIDQALKASCTESEWFPENQSNCEMSMALNKHMGAKGAMPPRRVHDPEGAKLTSLSYKTSERAVASIIKHKFQIIATNMWTPDACG